MKEIRLRLHISAEALLAYYRGDAGQVIATAVDGTRVQFPAHALRPYVTRDGVRGEFLLRCDRNNRLLGMQKLSG